MDNQSVAQQTTPLVPDAQGCRDYQRIAAAIAYIARRRTHQPTLDEVAAHVELSPFHFQRLFVRWAGVSPKQFLGYLTLQHAKELLRDQHSVLEAALESGLSGPGRLHDLFVTLEAMTPGEYKQGGSTMAIRYGVHPTPFGHALVLLTERGICGLRFVAPDAVDAALAEVCSEWPASRLHRDTAATAAALQRALTGSGGPQPLLVRGSRLQVQVWRALLTIPPGQLVSYGALADALGYPRAARAVGSAIGHNPIALLIPCHRVLRANGAVTGYRWGAERKAALIAWEAAQRGAAGSNP